jgi:glucose/arabinose dehydrogenase
MQTEDVRRRVFRLCQGARWAVAMAALAAATLMPGCGGGGEGGEAPFVPPAGALRATLLGATLASPWSLAFLPDGRMLVTQRGGSLVIVRADGSAVDAVVGGVPAVDASGQGGLLDVALDPDFATAPWLYLSFVEPGPGGSGTVLARARLVGYELQGLSVIWRQQPKAAGGIHFGSRIVFRPDKTLYLTVGDRGQDDPAAPTSVFAQNPAAAFGKVLRLNRDGSIPPGNPTFAAGALPGLWSLGHRNPQGAALRPDGSELWLTEHGPQGGDELNRIRAGANYGWPLRSYGCPYGAPVGDACRVGGGTHAPDFEEPASYWVPTSTAPAGMAFYNGDKFPQWRGQAFVGALAGRTLWRLQLDAAGQVLAREPVAEVQALGQRIRDVRQGPDGWIYLLTDEGRIVRLERER